jgi:hypothetical protein
MGVGFITEFVEPNICLDENLQLDANSQLLAERWSVPRLVVDVKARSGNDGTLTAEQALPGKLLIDQRFGWRNDSPLECMAVITVTRASKSWILSNPNAIQFRDRWTTIIAPDDKAPEVPVTTSIYNSQVGSAIDVGTNSVAEPSPGKQWVWASANCAQEIVGPIPPGEKLNGWYRQYVWTPPPWSNNANKNNPEHKAYGGWVRIQVMVLPQPGTLVNR